MAKTLIAFFSRADENYFGGSMKYIEVGNTEVVVGKIKDRIDADVLKIEMKTPYAKDYNTCIEEAKAHKNQNARPELVALLDSIDEYDTVILGYPNYWGTMPMAVFTFLDAFDFQGRLSFLFVPMKEAVWVPVYLILKSFVLMQMLRRDFLLAEAV